jgi:hypothetical protein
MIISHKYKLIFAAIPKTGTHSVRRALRDHMGPEDEEQVRLFVEKALPYAALAAMKHGHISLAQLKAHVPADLFGSYLKFAFVRNPYDRFVSFCAFRSRETGAFDTAPQQVMRNVLANPPANILFAPQHTFVCDADGALLADEIGRVEDMQGSYDRICTRAGVPTQALEHANSSRHNHYRDYYDDDLKAKVAQLYRRDLELFGYEF